MKLKKCLALLLLCTLLCLSVSISAFAADGDEAVRYVIDGNATADGYTLEIQADGIFAYTGRIALAFDTEKLRLAGEDNLSAFQLASGVNSVAEIRPENRMVSSDGGYACLAWYSSGLDTLRTKKTVATLKFQFKDGYGAEDIDASTFCLLPIEKGDFDPFASAASFRGKGDYDAATYEYLTDESPCGVSFIYDGSDKTPSEGYNVTFQCRNSLGNYVTGTLEMNGREYRLSDMGEATVILGRGEYLYRIRCAGYGDQRGTVNVRKDEEIVITVANDLELVQLAELALEIGYQPGDSATNVTKTLSLVNKMDNNVKVSWTSSDTSVVTKEGLVYPPDRQGVEVTLTATITRGSAKRTKTFTVFVAPKPKEVAVGNLTVTDPDEKQEIVDVPNFEDLKGYDWAKEAIERLAGLGIIRGTSETTFNPGANISRGDFVALLMRMLDTAGSANIAFDDVPQSSYYFKEIAQARALGIAQGAGDNLFHPNDPITREDMIVLSMRAINKMNYLPATAEKADLGSFSDHNQIADYARDSLDSAVARGLVVGSGGKLTPKNYTTRAETAVFLERIYSAHDLMKGGGTK